MVWSMVQDFLPFCSSSASSNSNFEAYILKTFMQSLKAGSWFAVPVTPIISGSKLAINFFNFSAVSLSGSTETKTVFKSKKLASLVFLTLATALLSLVRELGQMSGQCVNPKQMRQYLPWRSLEEKGLAQVLRRVQSPPILALPTPVVLLLTRAQLPFLLFARITWIYMQAQASARAMALMMSMVLPNWVGSIPCSLGISNSQLPFFSSTGFISALMLSSSTMGFLGFIEGFFSSEKAQIWRRVGRQRRRPLAANVLLGWRNVLLG